MCAVTASASKDDDEEIMIVIDEVKADDADETAAAAETAPPASSTIQPGLPSEKLSVADSGKEICTSGVRPSVGASVCLSVPSVF